MRFRFQTIAFGLLAGVFTALVAQQVTGNILRETDRDTFARRAGFFLSEINAVHPFRQGNGRTQRESIGELGLHAGIHMDWSRITRDQMTACSRESFRTGGQLQHGRADPDDYWKSACA